MPDEIDHPTPDRDQAVPNREGRPRAVDRRAAQRVAEAETAPPGGDDLEARIAERNEQYLRLAADFENFKRRKAQELTDRSRYASEEAATALLPVLDNLQRALATVSEEDGEGSLATGVRMVARDFEQALGRLGVIPMATVGERFDPAHHQAVGGEEVPGIEHDTVIEEYQRGYRLHDRVLRPAMVKVGHPAEPPARAEPPAPDGSEV